MSREPYNRVANSLRRVQQRLDRKEAASSRINVRIRDLDINVQVRDALLDWFSIAARYGALNVGELNTLRAILQTWEDATLAERLAVMMVSAELNGRPMTHVRHSILGLQARPIRLA